MPEERSTYAELGKYPLTVFSILVALIVAKFALGISFGPVTEVGRSGVKFAEETKKIREGAGGSQQVSIAQTSLLKDAPPGVRRALAAMSSETLMYVIDNELGQLVSDAKPESPDDQIYGELVKAGLCVQLSQKELKDEEAKQKKESDGLKKVVFGLRCGEMYEKTRGVMKGLISDLVNRVRLETRSP